MEGDPGTPTTSLKWMFGKTTISYVKIWNYPIETTIYTNTGNWLFGVPGWFLLGARNFHAFGPVNALPVHFGSKNCDHNISEL